MAKVDSSIFDISQLDSLSSQGSRIHTIDPRVKVLTTVFFIISVISFGKYETVRLLPFVAFPMILIMVGQLPTSYILKKVLLAAPFAFFVAIFNPFFDRAPFAHIGSVSIAGGWISFASIMIKFFLTVSAALVLIASTGFNSICAALARMGVPRSFTVQLLFLYRYLFVLGDEASRMVRARSLRSFGGKGMGMRVYSFMIGQLLLRTIDRAQRIHLAMLCRGFDGEIRLMRPLHMGLPDILFLLAWCGVFILLRTINVPQWIGDAVMGFAR